MNKEYIKITAPLILSTVTQPLIGMTDTAVIGQLGEISAIGGIALGTTLMNTIYWLLGFLRVCTTAESSKANSLGDERGNSQSLLLPMMLSLLLGSFIILLQYVILHSYIRWVNPSIDVAHNLSTYYKIVIWGAPAVLLNYSILGWLMGQRKIKMSLVMQIVGNIINVILDVVFVLKFSLGIEGVAAATLISQIIALAIGISSIYRIKKWNMKEVRHYINQTYFIEYMKNSGYLSLRTLFLLVHNNVLMSMATALGEKTLASVAIILQWNLLVAYLFEGIANGSSIYSGRVFSMQSSKALQDVFKITTEAYIFVAVIVISGLMWSHSFIWKMFTREQELIAFIQREEWVVLIFPIVTGIGITYYGIYTAMNKTKLIAGATGMALLAFLISGVFFMTTLYHKGIWISYLVFHGVRSLIFLGYRPRLCQTIFFAKQRKVNI